MSGKRAKRGQRERRDIVSGEVLLEPHLIRFVVGPDGQIVPDLSAKLPGRGIWVKADRPSLDMAVKQAMFSRSAKRRVTVPEGLSDIVAKALERRAIQALGFAVRAGLVVTGFEKVRAALKSGPPALRLEASDGAADGRGKVDALAAALWPDCPVYGQFSALDLGAALGRESAVHVLVQAGDGAQKLQQELDRLSGFAPQIPAKWQG